MKYLGIRNDGVLDIRLVSLMGGTTKSTDKFKIGQFGTGLKYYLAYCVRNNIDFKIFCGEEEVKITTEIELIRDEKFEILCIDGKRTSITTKMGESWEPWMIIREIWCNALDEGGACRAITDNPTGEEGSTTVYTQLIPEVQAVLDNWQKYYLHDQRPVCQGDGFSIYPGGNSLRLYKNGVLISEQMGKDLKSVFSYDIADAEINELREFKGTISLAVAQCLAKADKTAAEIFMQTVSQKHFEGNQDMEWYLTWSDSWREAIGDKKLIDFDAEELMLKNGKTINYDEVLVLPRQVYTVLSKQFPEVRGLYVSSGARTFMVHENPDLIEKINQAVETLRRCGIFFHPDIRFSTGYFSNSNVVADVNMESRMVCVSNKLADRSLFEVMTTIVEENAHVHTGFHDETRAFQQYFIDLYTKTLLEKNGIVL